MLPNAYPLPDQLPAFIVVGVPMFAYVVTQSDFTDRDGRPPIWWAAHYGYEGKRMLQARMFRVHTPCVTWQM